MCITLTSPSIGHKPNINHSKVVIKAVGKSDGDARFNDDDYFAAKATCSAVAKSLAMAEIYSNCRHQDHINKELIHMVKKLTSQLDNAQLMHSIANAAAHLVDAQMVCVHLSPHFSENLAHCLISELIPFDSV